MGTEYPLGSYSDKRTGLITDVSLDEMSNTLELRIHTRITDYDSGVQVCTPMLTPEQITGMALKMLQVVTYWTEDGYVGMRIAAFQKDCPEARTK